MARIIGTVYPRDVGDLLVRLAGSWAISDRVGERELRSRVGGRRAEQLLAVLVVHALSPARSAPSQQSVAVSRYGWRTGNRDFRRVHYGLTNERPTDDVSLTLYSRHEQV
jgi:hypothetical protein